MTYAFIDVFDVLPCVFEGLFHVLLDDVPEAVDRHTGVAVARVRNIPLTSLELG